MEEEPARVSVPRRGGLAALHLDGLAAQLIVAVRHAAAAQGVADDDQLIPKELLDGPDDGGVDVQAVTDQLHRGAAVQGRADDPGLPVEEGGHGVEEVGGVAGPRTIGRHGGLIAGSGVAEGDGAGLGDLPDKGDGPLLLRRHGDQADHAAAGLIEAVEHGSVRLVQVLRRLGAPLGVAQEGTLQVDAGALGAVRRAAEVPDGVHGGVRVSSFRVMVVARKEVTPWAA